MSTPTPAEHLTAAANHLRALATAASTGRAGEPTARWSFTELRRASGGGWGSGMLRAVDGLGTEADRLLGKALLHGSSMPRGRAPSIAAQHGEYIAAMDPTVGLALAAWLETEARAYTEDRAALAAEGRSAADEHFSCTVEMCTTVAALAVADAILAGGEQ